MARMKLIARSTSLSGHLVNRDNNFDVLRLLAAAMVLVSHAFPLAGRHEPGLWATSDTLGFVGVLIFFSISGFLIAQSWIADPRLWHFAAKRFLRIVPGLLVSVLLTAYVLGALVTTEKVGHYLESMAPVRYVIGNTLMLTDYSLPGVFKSNPSATVNGSLGTLPVEIKAYALIALFGLLVVSRSMVQRVVLAAMTILFLVFSFKTGVKPFWSLLDLFCLFAGAGVLYLIRRRITLRLDLFVVAIALWLVSYTLPLGLHAVFMALSLPYGVTFLGFRVLGRVRPITTRGDVSYGIYIYAFPVTQAAVHLGVHNPILVIVVVLPVTYALALASWRVIERPALAQKRRLARVSAPISPQTRRSTAT